MATWDPHYTPLLETHDHGQQPQLGGLLVARTGRGAWIYLGLALYRQLPEGVPGSYRLLANLISAAKSPASTPPPGSGRATPRRCSAQTDVTNEFRAIGSSQRVKPKLYLGQRR